ncbi:BZ3500_MvSof-1268-A1-R1_Chr9g10369 [Microbotryum saponariae]|uniref:signal-recognition-particle GTPase n=1 Tax=Microbotryum saponariae TaxID=289078 RepID=A0A2X0L3F3_9BASI|nr:BZ3501_MvSof-1269-A2-R1_Chr9g10119 [Microbotryum saponariae]SCZ99979.1 BZ3500_MvSof-1268-A1-R1_Chr9g10369 [Microbotryum saponariae]
MVLADLGRKLNQAISSLSASSPIDEAALDLTLKTVCTALLESDVNVQLVKRLRDKVKTIVLPPLVELQTRDGNQTDAVAGQKGKQLIHKTVFDQLVALVDPGDDAPPAFNPKKGRTSVIMMVGLQGAGFKTALVCADTFRAGAFDQLKQNAVKAKVPFFGSYVSGESFSLPFESSRLGESFPATHSYTETDPVSIALSGVTKFRSERFEVIIVDTSGRHRQESELFEEMVQISEAVEPDMTVLVLDGAIGQAAEPQSRAFKDASNFGAIIVTKLDGHAKGGGAISAVAATKTPIIFIGTGEHLHDLEKFAPRPFISKMLGMGDLTGLVEHAQEMAKANPQRRENLMKKLEKGEFTIADLKEQMATITGMGPLSKLTSMIPGMGDMMGGNADEAAKRMRRIAFIFDSMTQEELASDGSLFRPLKKGEKKKESTKTKAKFSNAATTSRSVKGKDKENASTVAKEEKKVEEKDLPEMAPREPNPRVLRIARGSGTTVDEVEELLAQHQMFSGMVKQAGGKTGWASRMQQQQAMAARRGGAGAGMGGMPPMGPDGMPDLSKLTPAQQERMNQMMGQMNPGIMSQMASLMGGGGMPGMGGAGGIPDMSKLMSMFGGGGGAR